MSSWVIMPGFGYWVVKGEGTTCAPAQVSRTWSRLAGASRTDQDELAAPLAPVGLAQGREIRAHEFHYSGLENADPSLAYAYRVRSGHGIGGERDGIVLTNLLASYTHLRAAGGCDWPARFVSFPLGCWAG
jgi:cobyrinic acid a,c-diamide synthase